MKAKLFEVIIHTKVDDDSTDMPETLHDNKHWAANEMAAGMKAMDVVNKDKDEAARISPDAIEVLVRPF